MAPVPPSKLGQAKDAFKNIKPQQQNQLAENPINIVNFKILAADKIVGQLSSFKTYDQEEYLRHLDAKLVNFTTADIIEIQRKITTEAQRHIADDLTEQERIMTLEAKAEFADNDPSFCLIL